ncbi:hypothetical protein V6N13_133778 [Hibiscus sabdariffa]
MHNTRAACKGFTDSIRLLLFLDAHRGRQDKEAIRGNLEACTVLVQAGKMEDLLVTDNSGKSHTSKHRPGGGWQAEAGVDGRNTRDVDSPPVKEVGSGVRWKRER